MKDKRLEDYDLKECTKYLVGGYEFEDIVKSLACVFGENDGPDWHYIVKLKDGKFAYIKAGCDYTGWGCQEGGTSYIDTTALKVVKNAPEKDFYDKNVRQQLIDQLKGKQPYGLQV